MKTRCLLFLFVGLVFALCAQVPPASAQRRPPWPPRRCPRPRGVGSCRQQCRNDRDCQAGEKCCFNGCGRKCIRVSGVHPPTNLGRCPRPQRPAVCARLCRSDRNCPVGQKCCYNGCGHQCMKAIRG